MSAKAAPALPQTCCPTVWLWPGQALYAGPSLNLAPHSGSVWCFAVGIGGPLTVTTPDGATREGAQRADPAAADPSTDLPRPRAGVLLPGADVGSRRSLPAQDVAEWRGEIGVGHAAEERLHVHPD